MSQNDLVIANQTFPSFRSDLNNALQALGSTNSGSSEPPTTYANMLWYDTSSNILKIRSEANDVWINISYMNQSTDTFNLIDNTEVVNTSGTQTGLIGDQATSTWTTGTGTTESLVSPAKVKAAVDANAFVFPISAGVVGSLAFLGWYTTDYVTNGFASGSSLYYAGITRSAGNSIQIQVGSSPSGSWRLWGYGTGGFTNNRASLWIRIS